MNTKVKNYVEGLFSDIPRNKKTGALKNDILTNMSDHFEEYIREGKTEIQAYTLSVSDLGNIDETLAGVRLSDEFIQKAHFYRKRNARNTAIGVSMYIIGAAFLIGLGGLGDYLGNGDVYSIIGLVILLAFAAAATALIVYSNMSIPPEYKDYNEDAKSELPHVNSEHARLFTNIMTIYWTLMAFIYLAISFTTWRWDITWLIWVPASVFQPMMKIYFESKYGADFKN